ncbi:MAG: 1-deoxy-D-xylulose-5-phosphate reductoisomerase [Gammaproteobacteria bacterium]
MIGVVVLGSTGSIGESTLDVLARHPDRFRVVGLGARRNTERLFEQVRRWRPDFVALADRDAAGGFAARLAATPQSRTRVLGGEEGLIELAQLAEVDCVMAAIVGAAGLRSTLAAARAGKRLLLANKESLVMAGPLVMAAAHTGGATLLPIDSEHNAIFQCLPRDAACGVSPSGVRRVLLTASGGPFLDWPTAALQDATPEQACAHPNWVMGRKISVDSATLMNKGLEVIEAGYLFGLDAERIEVVVHRQSVVHSLVEYVDGSVLAQLGAPDMRTPIAQAFAWPERMESGAPFLDLAKVGRLDFSAPDPARFPCLALAQAAARDGGLRPAILNAANEIAVQAFLERQLNFTGIPAVTETVLETMAGGNVSSLDDVLAADTEARARARGAIEDLRASQRSAIA